MESGPDQPDQVSKGTSENRSRGPAGSRRRSRATSRRLPPFRPATGLKRGTLVDLETLEDTPITIWTTDADGRVTSVLYTNILSDRESLVGGTTYDWLPRDEAERVMELKRRALSTRLLLRERMALTLQGEQRDYDLVFIPNLDEFGEVHGLTCICSDITERLDWLRESAGSTEEVPTEGRLGRIFHSLRSLLFETEAGHLAAPAVPTLTTQPFVDPQLHGVRGPSGDIRLSRTEWQLLERLTEIPGAVVSREALIEFIWGSEYKDDVRLLHDTVSRLRHRFHAAGLDPNLIETVHGVGYRIVWPDEA